MSLKKVSTNAPLKIISIVLAYGFWNLFNQMYPTLLTVSVPLCFYNTYKEQSVTAPETIKITLSGKRKDLIRINLSALAAHVDATKLTVGPNSLDLTREHLFVPPSCKLVHYKPSNILILVDEGKTVA